MVLDGRHEKEAGDTLPWSATEIPQAIEFRRDRGTLPAAWVRRQCRRLATRLAVTMALLSIVPAVAAQTVTQQREAAVLKARAGQTVEAQAALRALLAAGADDGLVAMDLVVLLHQDGKPAEAVSVFERAGRIDPPAYALLAATRSYRDLRRFEEAVRLSRDGARRFSTDPAWPLLLSMVLSDAGRPGEALVVLRQPLVLRAPPVERLLAEGYAHRRAGDPFAAMKAYAEALLLAPGNAGVRGDYAAVLREMGAPYGAAMIAGTTLPIAGEQAGAMVRWGGAIRLPEPARRFDGTDAALVRLEGLLSTLPPGEEVLRRRLRLDRVVALRDRVRMQEAQEEAALLRADAMLPSYAEEAYADALLYLKRPGEARESYERVLAQSPRNIQARFGKFFASVELEDFATAYAVVDGLVTDEPVFPSYRQDPTQYDNPDRTYAEVIAAQARLFGNQLGDAWARISRMAAAAPANSLIRLTGQHIARARGWPRLAEAEAQIAASLEPRDVTTGIALVEVAIARFHYAEADRLMAELLAVFPEHQAVRHLARELEAQRRWLLEVQATPSLADGGGPNSSGQSMLFTGRLHTPPLGDHWRIFGLGDYANARPPEGYIERSRVGAGVEWRELGFRATAYPTLSWGTLNRAGAGATADWWVTDHVLLALAAESFSLGTPLRALRAGITSDEVALSATYRWHESRSVLGSVAYQPFTDGNQRLTGGLGFRERLIDVPHFDLTGRVDAGASRNTRTDAPYYNPAQDLTLTAGLLAEHVAWRRYDKSFVQALAVDAGIHSEQGFGDNLIGTAAYEHRWRFDPLTELRYGVSLTRRSYDGNVEQGLAFTIALRQRL